MAIVRYRTPTVQDSTAIYNLVDATDALDLNSWYYYAIFFRDFSKTCLIAEVDGRLGGFVTGYTRPERPDTLFLWQTATTLTHGVSNLGLDLLSNLVATVRDELGISYVEATTDPENKAIEMQFRLLSRRLGAEVNREILFAASEVDELAHDEQLVRLGPL